MSDVKYKNIYISPKVVNFQITKFSDIVNTIIPFFNKYPCFARQGQKALDFEDFKTVSEIMRKNDHLTAEGLAIILKIKNEVCPDNFISPA